MMKSAIIIVAVLSTALLSQALDPVVERDVAPLEQAEMLVSILIIY